MHIFFAAAQIWAHTHKQTFINLCTINHTVKLLYAPTFLCDRHIQRNQGVRITSYVLNRGHTGNSSYHREQVKDRQTIMGGFEEWLRRPKATGHCTGLDLSGSATRLRSAAPDTILYGGSYLQWWNGGEERVQSTPDLKKNGRFRHMSGPSQKRARRHTEIYPKEKKTNTNGRTGRYTICQSQGSISVALSQRWHKPKSAWLKLDLSSSARAVSVASESFSLDWWHSVTLVSVTVSLWQVTGVCSRTLQQTYTQPLQNFFFFVAECYCWY